MHDIEIVEAAVRLFQQETVLIGQVQQGGKGQSHAQVFGHFLR